MRDENDLADRAAIAALEGMIEQRFARARAEGASAGRVEDIFTQACKGAHRGA